jgi:hypothetical protein
MLCSRYVFLTASILACLTLAQIGHLTLNNTESNAMAMQELELLLADHEMAVAVDFNPLNHRMRCYAHIINICSSHIVASATSISKSHLSLPNVPVGGTHDSDDELDDGSADPNDDIAVLKLADCYDDKGNP